MAQSKNTKPSVQEDKIDIEYKYAVDVAGSKFLTENRDNGRAYINHTCLGREL